MKRIEKNGTVAWVTLHREQSPALINNVGSTAWVLDNALCWSKATFPNTIERFWHNNGGDITLPKDYEDPK
jgi:hypothetical protein